MNWTWLYLFFVIGAIALLLCETCWHAAGVYGSDGFLQASEFWKVVAAALFALGFAAVSISRGFHVAFDAFLMAIIPYAALKSCFSANGRIRDRVAYDEAAIVRADLRRAADPIVQMPVSLASAGGTVAHLVWFMACVCLGVVRPAA